MIVNKIVCYSSCLNLLCLSTKSFVTFATQTALLWCEENRFLSCFFTGIYCFLNSFFITSNSRICSEFLPNRKDAERCETYLQIVFGDSDMTKSSLGITYELINLKLEEGAANKHLEGEEVLQAVRLSLAQHPVVCIDHLNCDCALAHNDKKRFSFYTKFHLKEEEVKEFKPAKPLLPFPEKGSKKTEMEEFSDASDSE